jgi:hypothetical protein
VLGDCLIAPILERSQGDQIGRISARLGEFLPDWANFSQIGRILARLGEFLYTGRIFAYWANFCQIGRIFAKLGEFLHIGRIFARLGEFLPVGQLVSFASILKITEVVKILKLLFYAVPDTY